MKVVPKKSLSSTNLSRAQALSIYKFPEIFIINENKDFIFAIF